MFISIHAGSHSDQQWLQTSSTIRMSQVDVQINDTVLVSLFVISVYEYVSNTCNNNYYCTNC